MPFINTSPNYPAQPEKSVENATKDLPSVLQEMSNESGYGASDPGHGHRIVLASRLVEELSGKRGHTLPAAAWAIHQLVQRGLLLAEIGTEVERLVIGYRPDENNPVVKARRFFGSLADSPRYQVPDYGDPVVKPLASADGPVPYEHLLVRSTPELWEWWKQEQQHADKTPKEIFFSYSHKDEKLRDKLATHLSQLKNEELVTDWHDRKILAGAEWEGQIDQHLNSAQIILLLVSADFLASRYCYDVEMKRAVERHEAGEARVIPIILRPCDWASAPFGKLQALPKDGRPVTKWKNQDEAFADVAKSIRTTLLELPS